MNEENGNVDVNEIVVLSKFEGDGTDPDTEFERVTIDNGVVISHDQIENGEVVGPVENSDIIGANIGTLTS